MVLCELEDLSEGEEGVLTSNGVLLEVADVIVRCEKDFYRAEGNRNIGR